MAAKCGDAPTLGEPETDIVVSDNGTGVSLNFINFTSTKEKKIRTLTHTHTH